MLERGKRRVGTAVLWPNDLAVHSPRFWTLRPDEMETVASWLEIFLQTHSFVCRPSPPQLMRKRDSSDGSLVPVSEIFFEGFG